MNYRTEKNGSKHSAAHPGRKMALVLTLAMCLTAMLLTGCGVRVNVSRDGQNVEDLPVNQDLAADPAVYNESGDYEFIFHYDRGGFERMDLSQAYVAYYAMTIQDQIDSIVDGESEDFPPLPEDVQIPFDESIGAMQLKKIAVIKIRTLNDNTLSVSFKDKDDPVPGREYFFIIPNAGLGGSVIAR